MDQRDIPSAIAIIIAQANSSDSSLPLIVYKKCTYTCTIYYIHVCQVLCQGIMFVWSWTAIGIDDQIIWQLTIYIKKKKKSIDIIMYIINMQIIYR